MVALATEPVSFSGEAKKAGKKVVGGAALGAGIGGTIDGGEERRLGRRRRCGGRRRGREVLAGQSGGRGCGHGSSSVWRVRSAST